MSKIYFVDLPNSLNVDGPWEEIAEFDNLMEAIVFVEEHFGGRKGRIDLISSVETDDDEYCSCCGSGLNTVSPCPTCGEPICDDCSDSIHICDPN